MTEPVKLAAAALFRHQHTLFAVARLMLGRIRRSASFGRRGSSSSDRAPRVEQRNPINNKTHKCCALQNSAFLTCLTLG